MIQVKTRYRRTGRNRNRHTVIALNLSSDATVQLSRDRAGDLAANILIEIGKTAPSIAVDRINKVADALEEHK